MQKNIYKNIKQGTIDKNIMTICYFLLQEFEDKGISYV